MKPLEDIALLYRAVVGVLDAAGGVAGTGFFMGDGGLILTAAHVIAEEGDPPDTVQVFALAGDTRASIEAEVLRELFFADEATDLAVLRLRGGPPPDARWLEPGGLRPLPGRLHGFGFPQMSKAGLGALGLAHTYLPDPPRLQLQSAQVTPGYSGGPLVDADRRCVVAMTQSILRRDPATGKRSDECFGVPIERIGARLAAAHAELTTLDTETDRLIGGLITAISRRVGPRMTWPDPDVDLGRGATPRLAPADSERLTSAALRCLGEAPDGDVLLRLPPRAQVELRAGIAAGKDWRPALLEVCRTHTGLLRLIAAILVEVDRPEAAIFDDLVREVLLLTHSDTTLREHAARLRDVDVARLLGLAAAAGVRSIPGIHEARGGHDAALLFVRSLAAQTIVGDVLARILADVAGGVLVDGPTAPPAAMPEECALVVVVTPSTGGGVHAVFWGVPQPGEQQNLGDWEGPSIRDPGLLDELREAVSRLRRTWDVPTDRVTVEVALPRALLCEQVEQWLFRATPRVCEPLGASYQVVLRSWEKIYDRWLQDYWSDWKQKWSEFTADPSLEWIYEAQRGDLPALEDAIRSARGIGLGFPHNPDHQDDDDPIGLCIDSMVPVALWFRDDACPANPIHVPAAEQIRGLRAWVWKQRQQARQGRTGPCRGVVLMWDDPHRIPIDARARRENVSTRKDP